jgi:SAM-dependent methyltransferase
MNDDQRSTIRDSANYLRQVRPVDPEELCEYVEGQPHPAAVRQVLREEAADLGLLEREDGRFEPAPEGSLEVEFDGVDALPADLSRAVEELLVERFGPAWPDGESGARLRAVVRDFKRQYLAGGTVTYDEVTALGYAVYHLPQSFAASQHVLADLAASDRLPADLRVLDVGAGVGGPALGIDRLVPEGTLVEYHAVEPGEAATVLESLLAETGRNFHPTVHDEPVEAFEPTGNYDLVVFANVLSELEAPVTEVRRLLGALAPAGTVLALAPADRETAIGLREIERGVERETEATVYAPTVRLWPHERAESASWSFDRRPPLAVPAFQRRLDEGERTDSERTRRDEPEDSEATEVELTAQAENVSNVGRPAEREPGDGEFVNVDLQYAYSVLVTDGTRALDTRPDRGQVAKLAETERHVTDRVDCVAVKLSPDLSEGENALFLIGDGSQQVDHFAVLTRPSTLNNDLERSDYGDLLRFENVLVLWNDDEEAYNLVVDGETVVDLVETA